MLELPALDQFANEGAAEGVSVLSIVVKGDPSTVRRLTGGNRATTLLDPLGNVADRYHVTLQPYTIVISDLRVTARFAGAAKQVGLLDALRSATGTHGGPVVTRAGSDWRRGGARLVQKSGQWFDGWRAVARVNEGRWVTQPDGVYIDPKSQRVLALTTVRGRPAEAFALGEVHARRALGLAAEEICADPGTPRRPGVATSPTQELLGSQPACPCLAHESFAHVDPSSETVRVAVFWVGTVFRQADARYDHPDGTVTFSGKPGNGAADVMPAIRRKLMSDGRLLPDPLGPTSSR